jgi:hypothetical protein
MAKALDIAVNGKFACPKSRLSARLACKPVDHSSSVRYWQESRSSSLPRTSLVWSCLEHNVDELNTSVSVLY